MKIVPKDNRTFQICIIGNSIADNKLFDIAYQIGKICGETGATVITGGGFGVMEAASKGACEAGSLTVGIIRNDKFESANKYCKVVIPSSMGHLRNGLNILSADLVIGVSGGAGTLSEYAFASIEKKPIIAFTGYEGWSDKLAGKRLDHRTDRPKVIPIKDLNLLKYEIIKIAQNLGFDIL